ncbi:hypothetical protein ABK040_002591 [Willaertia magna]
MGGLLEDSVVKVQKGMGIIILLINVFFPGIGTLLAGIMTEEKDKSQSAIIVGILQIVLSCCCIGWLWAIWTGIQIMQASDN